MDITERKITKIAREAEKLVLRTMRETGVGTAEIDLIHALRHNPGCTQAALAELLKNADIRVLRVDGSQHMTLGGEDVETLIRTPEISMAASDVASCPSVRRALVALQQKIAAGCDVVMDGRDIGTRVLPDADYKFFLTASDKVRAQRRYDELKAKGESVTLQEVLEDVRRRDEQDTTRAESPLTIADDATEVETDDLGIDEVVTVLMALMGRF